MVDRNRRTWVHSPSPSAVPSRIECATCGRDVCTAGEPAVCWGEHSWCIDCWFQGANRMGRTAQQVPLLYCDRRGRECDRNVPPKRVQETEDSH